MRRCGILPALIDLHPTIRVFRRPFNKSVTQALGVIVGDKLRLDFGCGLATGGQEQCAEASNPRGLI